jgi:periplasmic protein TonB
MMSEQDQDRKNKRIAFISTIGIHGILFTLMFLLVAYRAPDPPLSDLGAGIELNIGFDDEGGGDDPMITPVGDNGDQQEEVQDQTQEAQQQEELKETVREETKPEAPKEDEKLITSNDESSVAIKEKKDEVKPADKPKEKVEEKKVEVKPQAVFKPTEKKTESNANAGGAKEGTAGSEGDDAGKTGNKGKPEGTLVKGGQYTGTPGGGGSSLELSGWAWDQKPNPDVPNNESGRLVFEIKVDENGDIVSIKTLERSVSQEAEQICRKEIQKLSFTQTGTNVPAISTGKITFVVRSK